MGKGDVSYNAAHETSYYVPRRIVSCVRSDGLRPAAGGEGVAVVAAPGPGGMAVEKHRPPVVHREGGGHQDQGQGRDHAADSNSGFGGPASVVDIKDARR